MKTRMFQLVAGVLLAQAAWAGGGPQNVLVVFNHNSIESQELANHYREARGIPPRNLCRVFLPPTEHNMPLAMFQTGLVSIIQRHIKNNGLTNQIDFLVLCKDIPSRVNNAESVTASLFYGFKNAPVAPLQAATSNGYYKAEKAFSHQDSYSGTNAYLAFFLTARNLDQAMAVVNRSVQSDQSRPPGAFYLLAPPGDPNRNIRYKLFDNFIFQAAFLTNFPAFETKAADYITGKTNILGYQTGLPGLVPLETNTYLPGALCDHFTSYGGYLPDGAGQSTVWDWMDRGATLSYGTVTEPYALLEKFPDPLALYWYARGFSAGESYYMSVAHPYEGLFVGDPLAAPYARPPSIQITNLAPGQVVSGIVTVECVAAGGETGVPVKSIEWYVNDLWAGRLTNVNPRTGNRLAVEVGGKLCTHTVAPGETLYSAINNLAYSINASNTEAFAYAHGDRLLLVYTNYGTSGSNIEYSASVEIGTASELPLAVQAATERFMESTFPAREFIALTPATANAGDQVSCVITLTNGLAFTNVVTATSGESSRVVLGRLLQAINETPALQATNGVWANAHSWVYQVHSASLDARTPGPEGYHLQVAFTVTPSIPGSGLSTNDSFSDRFNDNRSDLTARGTVFFTCGKSSLTARLLWDTTQLPNGPHTLRFVAKEGAGPETQGYTLLPLIISNNAFSASILTPTNGQHVILASNVFSEVAVAGAPGIVTQVHLHVQDQPWMASTSPPHQFTWSSRNQGVGLVRLQALASDNSGARARSAPVEIQVVRSPTLDTDGDGIPDSWEQTFFGGLYLYGHDDDPDGDQTGNFDEFVADTDPSNPASLFRLATQQDANTDVLVSFPSSTSRVYLAQYSDTFSTNQYAWNTASPSPFAGDGGLYLWRDDGSQTGVHPSATPQRTYRINAALP